MLKLKQDARVDKRILLRSSSLGKDTHNPGEFNCYPGLCVSLPRLLDLSRIRLSTRASCFSFSMALFRWEEITTKAWIFSLALVVLVVWFAWPVIETSGRLIQLLLHQPRHFPERPTLQTIQSASSSLLFSLKRLTFHTAILL
jgi:hypothetical protein